MEIKLHYQEKGEGEPMILLHGNGEDGSYFAHQMDYFSRNYRVIVVDTSGMDSHPEALRHLPLLSLQRICMILWMSLTFQRQ